MRTKGNAPKFVYELKMVSKIDDGNRFLWLLKLIGIVNSVLTAGLFTDMYLVRMKAYENRAKL